MTQIEKERSPEALDREDFGVVVGWTHQKLGDRLVLTLQSTREGKMKPAPADVHDFRYFLTRSQAAVLGSYLFEISGQSPPEPPRRGLLRRLLRF